MELDNLHSSLHIIHETKLAVKNKDKNPIFKGKRAKWIREESTHLDWSFRNKLFEGFGEPIGLKELSYGVEERTLLVGGVVGLHGFCKEKNLARLEG